MAGVTHTFTSSIKVPGLPTMPADPAVIITGDYSVEVEVDVPAGTVSLSVPVGTIDKDKIVSLVMNADKTAMDVYTNAANGTGGQHFTLAANNSLGWNNTMNQSLFALPIDQSITDFYLDNSTSKAGIFRCSFLMQV